MVSLRWLVAGALGLGAAALFGPRLYTALRYGGELKQPAEASAAPVAVVFGAGVRRDGRPTPVLYDRVAAAVELYHQGKVGQLLLSGDGRNPNFSEPRAMRALAIELGVPAEALTLDEAGWSTYDTCWRARNVYGVDRALLVTQNFHLPRALFLCEALGVQTGGVSADRRAYLQRSLALWNLRELLATANAVWQVILPQGL